MNTKKPLGYGLIAVILAFTLAIIGCRNPAGSTDITADTAITAAAVTITGPAKGVAPVTTAPAGGTGYTCGAVSWSPNDNPFKGGTVYTAMVTLTANEGYTFTGLTDAFVNAQAAVVSGNTGKSVTLSLTFAATEPDDSDYPKPVHVHVWGEWYISIAPTATKSGVETRNCSNFPPHTEDRIIPATGIRVNPLVAWPQDLTATYGQTLADIPLDSYTSFVTGTFEWARPGDFVGEVFNIETLSHEMIFTPTDTADYNTVTGMVIITVNNANITEANITITAPVKGSVRTFTAVTTDTGYHNRVIWSPDEDFLGGTVYTATVELWPDNNYTLANLSSATINGQTVNIICDGFHVTLSYTFAETDARTAISMWIANRPERLDYIHNETLDLTGLNVFLTYDDDTFEDVAATDFVAKNITVNPAHGIHLVHVTHNGHPITITYGKLTQSTTYNLSIYKAPGNFGTPAAIYIPYTPALTLADLNSHLPLGYAWNAPSTSLSAGNGQSFTATYTNPDGNHESAAGTITVNVAKAAGIFAAHAAINTTYTPWLTLSDLNSHLSSGYAWLSPLTSLNAGNGQSFYATYIDPSGNYEIAPGTITVNIAKATGATVSAPTAATIGVNSVTLNALSANTGQTVEYATNSTNAAPSTGWQTSTTFGDLNVGTTYYFFARAAGNNNYETGAASGGTAIIMKQQAENEIIGYWVDDTGELTVGNGGQSNVVTVTNGSSVTFTANSAGYSNQSWTLNGSIVGAGASYTFNTADNDKEVGRNYIIGLRVQKDGKYYFTEITVKVVE